MIQTIPLSPIDPREFDPWDLTCHFCGGRPSARIACSEIVPICSACTERAPGYCGSLADRMAFVRSQLEMLVRDQRIQKLRHDNREFDQMFHLLYLGSECLRSEIGRLPEHDAAGVQ